MHALQLIMAWMEGYPSYLFKLESIDKLGKDIDAKTAYIAAVAQYYVNNKEAAADPRTMKLESWKIFLKYCENPSNNIKTTKALKKLIDASKINDSTLNDALK